ncbi:NAD(P)-dependent dehydrogenase, short-chain alcohol dehydrogenase family [Cognatiyoonia koreensis]|uniref:NAD(P)-dependent dehydrogenase, short-chain alcohol dehydrogenase family n=1 Tax=Cognatiyoonia koreensis TaxID=364200 RepID=A0A1I0QJK9_9RHOB|nr:SDR family NAD(P)-dependent oxidoreductase [Cognatiyoonia koreensis]SEW27383.1 NAD(P)-dependent dehydrogenase, short-chain alcohol dehydrogenase family [Cognatiyoonia koreensis]
MKTDGQRVLVAGGGSGLGAATARYLSERGAHVTVLDFNLDAAQAIAADIKGSAVQADVSDPASVAAAFADMPPVRIAVNCAGIADAARIVGREGKLSLETFERVIRVNLIGTYAVMSYAAQGMMTLDPLGEERGVIVNTASAAYEDGQLGQSAYAASKGGIASMCLPAAREFAKLGIRVMAIAPGLFHTPMMEGLPDETTAQIASNIPFPPRLGDPAEFARMVGDIVENPYLNGTVIRLDGAVRLPPR